MTDLQELVARAIYDAWNISGVPFDSPIVKGNAFREGKVQAQADAAIAVVIEELAQRADERGFVDAETIPGTGGDVQTTIIGDWLRAQGETHE